MEHIDTLVIGAGVVGLAIARRLSQHYPLAVIERHARAGEETSSHNSGVIHAGIYYPSSFLKTRLCIEGRELLYAYARENGIDHQQCGKLVLAIDEDELPQLNALQNKAQQNGIELQWLDQAALQEKEPYVQAKAALFSPVSGIIDSAQLIMQLMADTEQHGGHILFGQKLENIRQTKSGFEIHINGSEPVSCRQLINAAGLNAIDIANMIVSADLLPRQWYVKGNYFSYQSTPPFSHLVYPLPEAHNKGLGIHATLDIAGMTRFGPDSHYIDSPNYQVDANVEDFARAIQRYFPALEASKLAPDYAGVRPKIQGPNEPVQDFMIQDASHHNIPGLINLMGIESPGLTASLAIAETVANRCEALHG